MSGPEFFQTGMGAKFYEGTMPAIARALTRIADSLENLEKAAEKAGFIPSPPEDKES